MPRVAVEQDGYNTDFGVGLQDRNTKHPVGCLGRSPKATLDIRATRVWLNPIWISHRRLGPGALDCAISKRV